MTGVESKAKHPHPQSNPEGLLETRLAHPRVSLPRGGGDWSGTELLPSLGSQKSGLGEAASQVHIEETKRKSTKDQLLLC